MVVECRVETPKWAGVDIEALASRACSAALSHLSIPTHAEISILACSDARIAELNADFRGKSNATNVLSWPTDERAAERDGDMPDLQLGDDPELGDIAIAYETCAQEAETAGRSMADHTVHLLVHGVLHLLGFDHERDADATLMEQFEVEILGDLGIANPYEV